MKVTITPTTNGAYVEYDDGETVDRVSYKFDSEDPEDAIGLCCDLTDFMGLMGSRHDKKRLHFDVRHGDKYECSGCEICSKDN